MSERHGLKLATRVSNGRGQHTTSTFASTFGTHPLLLLPPQHRLMLSRRLSPPGLVATVELPLLDMLDALGLRIGRFVKRRVRAEGCRCKDSGDGDLALKTGAAPGAGTIHLPPHSSSHVAFFRTMLSGPTTKIPLLRLAMLHPSMFVSTGHPSCKPKPSSNGWPVAVNTAPWTPCAASTSVAWRILHRLGLLSC